jgi:hypothetical protein
VETKDSKENRKIDVNMNTNRISKPGQAVNGGHEKGSGGGGSGGGSISTPLVIPSPRTQAADAESGSGGGSGLAYPDSVAGDSDPLASPDLDLSSDLDMDMDLLANPKSKIGEADGGGGEGGSFRRSGDAKPQETPIETPIVSPRGPRTSGFDQPAESLVPAPSVPAPAPAESFLDSDSGDWDEEDPLEASVSLGAGGGGMSASGADQRSPARSGGAGIGGRGAAAARSAATTSPVRTKVNPPQTYLFVQMSEGSNLEFVSVRQCVCPTTQVKKGGPKCKQAYLGGGGAQVGHGSAFSKLACPNMRCTGCDFTVMRIDKQRWSDELDYLFLRNHVPFMDKLQPMLTNDPSNCAYACQCSSKVGTPCGHSCPHATQHQLDAPKTDIFAFAFCSHRPSWPNFDPMQNVTEFLNLKKACASSNLRWVCAGH